MANLLERFKQLMPAISAQNELHEKDEKAVNHGVAPSDSPTKEGSASIEPTNSNRSFVKLQTALLASDTAHSCNSSLSYGDETAPELRSIWRALHHSTTACLELIQQDDHLIVWLEYRTQSKCWVSTPPVTADRKSLAALIARFAAAEPDALIVAIKSARGLHPEINPARQEVAQRARFSATLMTA